jgi:adenine-specific DNA-methyltransferase
MTEFETAVFPDGRLILGDCNEVLPTIPLGSIDLTITSPPYFMGKDYDRSLSVSDFETEIRRVQSAIYGATKEGGAICWQVGSHVQHNVVIPLDLLVYQICSSYSDLQLRNRIIWTFEHGINSTKRFSGRHETILWYTKGGDFTFNLDDVRIPQKYPGKRYYKGPKRGELSGNPSGKNPGDVWALPNVKANHIEKTEHPCQFPVGLVSRIVRATTSRGEMILDPFAGSGTTAIAAVENRRRFCCIEREQKYFDIARGRIEDWYAGRLSIRDESAPIEPDPSSKVAQRPEHFIGAET